MCIIVKNIGRFYMLPYPVHCGSVMSFTKCPLIYCMLWSLRWFLTNIRHTTGKFNVFAFPSFQYHFPCLFVNLPGFYCRIQEMSLGIGNTCSFKVLQLITFMQKIFGALSWWYEGAEGECCTLVYNCTPVSGTSCMTINFAIVLDNHCNHLNKRSHAQMTAF